MTTLTELAREAASCIRCDLYQRGDRDDAYLTNAGEALQVDARQEAFTGFVADLVKAREALAA